MIKLNVHEAKTHLSEYLAKLEQGDPIVLRKRNRPIAGIRPIPALSDAPRPMVSGMISSSTGERTVAAIDNRWTSAAARQAIAQGLMILTRDPDITRHPLRTAW